MASDSVHTYMSLAWSHILSSAYMCVYSMSIVALKLITSVGISFLEDILLMVGNMYGSTVQAYYEKIDCWIVHVLYFVYQVWRVQIPERHIFFVLSVDKICPIVWWVMSFCWRNSLVLFRSNNNSWNYATVGIVPS